MQRMSDLPNGMNEMQSEWRVEYVTSQTLALTAMQ